MGSGTQDAAKGCTARTRVYEDKKHIHLPRFVREAYDKGYKLGHVGMLCWISLPFMIGKQRLRFLVYESVFTCMFCSAYYTIMESFWSGFMPWTCDEVSWVRLNSHVPSNECVGEEFDYTHEWVFAIKERCREKWSTVCIGSDGTLQHQTCT